MAGLTPDPWQEYVTHSALGEREDGRWASFEVGVDVARQNGKGGELEIRELAGLFLLGEQLIIHSAHEFATAEEALERMAAIIEGCADLSRRVKVIKRSHGQEGIYLTNGQRLRYKTRTKGGGRGFTADCVILDEAMIIPEAFLGALMPTLSARPNPQLWYTGSAVDKRTMEHGLVFARLRERALKGEDPSLAYFGWSAPFDNPSEVPAEAAADPEMWALANPALGIRISTEHVAKEQRSMDARTFAVERLGVGDWPEVDNGDTWQIISQEMWGACLDDQSEALDPVCFAIDVSPNRSSASIGSAGKRSDDSRHVELVARDKGTGWIVDRIVELVVEHDPVGVVLDEKSPAASLLPALTEALAEHSMKVTTINGPEYAQACGQLFDEVDQGHVKHIGQPDLTAAVRGAVKRPLGDQWAWSRSKSSVDITPLVTCTLALWGLEQIAEETPFVFEVFA